MSGANEEEPAVPFRVVARAVFLSWEKLRLLYLGILAPWTLLLVAGAGLRRPGLWLTVALGAVFANACYFAGPLLETYARWLGAEGVWLRRLLFAGGDAAHDVLRADRRGHARLPGLIRGGRLDRALPSGSAAGCSDASGDECLKAGLPRNPDRLPRRLQDPESVRA